MAYFRSDGDGFLADVVTDWEAAAESAAGRVVQVRTGLVQAPQGGVLRLQRPGRGPLDGATFLRGFELSPGTILASD